MAKILDGKAVSASVKEQVANETAALKEKGITPGLAVVIVGDDPASHVYVNNKRRRAPRLASIRRNTRCPRRLRRRSCWLSLKR